MIRELNIRYSNIEILYAIEKNTMSSKDLQLDWLRAFVTVVDAGTLSAAAPLVNRSQSAVSMQIQKLETAVGRTLLSRGPRHLVLTPEGHALLPHARHMLDAHTRALASLSSYELTGQVRLGVPDDYAASYFTPVARSFVTKNTGVEIILDCEQSTALVPRVLRSEIDLALVSRDGRGRGKLLFEEPLVWVGSPEFELWRRETLPIAVYEAGSQARKAAEQALKKAHREYRIVVNTPSLAGQLAAVESGVAVAVLTRCSAPPSLQILGDRAGLPSLPSMTVALIRSAASRGHVATDALEQEMLRILSRKK